MRSRPLYWLWSGAAGVWSVDDPLESHTSNQTTSIHQLQHLCTLKTLLVIVESMWHRVNITSSSPTLIRSSRFCSEVFINKICTCLQSLVTDAFKAAHLMSLQIVAVKISLPNVNPLLNIMFVVTPYIIILTTTKTLSCENWWLKITSLRYNIIWDMSFS